jgi:uncharacterized protein (TIGR03000 family)
MFKRTVRLAGMAAVAYSMFWIGAETAFARGGGHGGGGHGGGHGGHGHSHGHFGHSSHVHHGSIGRYHTVYHNGRISSNLTYYSGFGYGYPWYGTYYNYPRNGYGYGYSTYANYFQPTTPILAAQSQGAEPAANEVAFLVVTPPNATVWVNGTKTNQTGPEREFMSDDLSPGGHYTYTFRATWTAANGQSIDQTRQVKVTGGEKHVVDFFAPPR